MTQLKELFNCLSPSEIVLPTKIPGFVSVEENDGNVFLFTDEGYYEILETIGDIKENRRPSLRFTKADPEYFEGINEFDITLWDLREFVDDFYSVKKAGEQYTLIHKETRKPLSFVAR